MSESGGNALDGGHLKAFIERIERLEEEKKAIADDIKEVYAEAKGTGYDVKIMRKVVSIRKQDAQQAPRGRGNSRSLSLRARSRMNFAKPSFAA